MGIDIGGFIGSVAGGIFTGGAGPAIGAGIGNSLPTMAEAAKTIVDRLLPNPQQLAEIEAKKTELQVQLEAALTARENRVIDMLQQQNSEQNAINLAEAQGNDRFSSRWRPALGWVGVVAIAWQFVVGPIVTWLASILGAIYDVAIPVPPTADTSQLWVVITGLLGLSATRTIERTQGVPGALPPQLPVPQTPAQLGRR